MAKHSTGIVYTNQWDEDDDAIERGYGPVSGTRQAHRMGGGPVLPPYAPPMIHATPLPAASHVNAAPFQGWSTPDVAL